MSDMYDVKTRQPLGQKIVRRDDGSLDVSTINDEPSMTQQQFAAECDINNIMKKYDNTGLITHLARKPAMYGDFSGISDYQGMLDTIRYADEAFMTLPASTRQRFENDPQKLLNFLHDEKNFEEGVKLGFLKPREKPAAQAQNAIPQNANPAPAASQPAPISNPA